MLSPELIWGLYRHMRIVKAKIDMPLINSIIRGDINGDRIIEIYEDLRAANQQMPETIYTNIIAVLAQNMEYAPYIWKIYESIDKKMLSIGDWKIICKYFVKDLEKMLIIYDTIKNNHSAFSAVHMYLVSAFHNCQKIEDVYERITDKNNINISLKTVKILLRYFNGKEKSCCKMRYLFTKLDEFLSITDKFYGEFPNYYDIMLQTYNMATIKHVCDKMKVNNIAMGNNKLSAILEAYLYNNKFEEAISILGTKYSDNMVVFVDENVSLIRSIIYIRYIQNDMPMKIKSIYNKDFICEYIGALGFDAHIVSNDVIVNTLIYNKVVVKPI